MRGAAGDLDQLTLMAIVLSRRPGGAGGGGAPSGPAGGILGGTYPNPTFATDVAAPFVLAETTVPAGGAANIDFQNINQTYRHLRIMLLGRAEAATANMQMTFNNDTGNNYDWELVAMSTAVGAAEGVGVAFVRVGSLPGSSAPASVFGSTVMNIPFYRAATHKTCSYLQELKLASSTTNIFTVPGSGLWRNTAAITRITLAPSTGDFNEGTLAVLYGSA